jgi:hypothetical protein
LKRFLSALFLCLSALSGPAFAQYDGYGLTGTYYTNDNLTSAAATVNDPFVSFLWYGCPPQPNMSTSIFSVQWTGWVEPAYSGPCTFLTYVAGGVSVIVGGVTLISQWTDSANTSYQGVTTLTAGTKYPLVVDYFTDGGNLTGDHIQLVWSSASQPQETIPRENLFTGAAVAATPTPQTASACQAETANITVDGLLDQWAWGTAGWNTVSKTVIGNTFGATASFKTLWDSNNLYLGVTVTDSVLTPAASTTLYNYSTVELYLDTTDSKSVTVGGTDYEYFFSWGATTAQEGLGRTAGVTLKTTAIPTGYVVEASIPWSTLGMASPGSGTVLGLDLGVDVNHNGGNCRDGEIMWNGGPDNYTNASNYGQMTLAAACPTPMATPPAPAGGNPYVSPNPTNGSSVQFVYTMAQAGTANIKVWNAWGNLVATISEPKGAGEQSSVLNVTSFAPGHYFYRVELDYGPGQKDVFKTQVLAVKK